MTTNDTILDDILSEIGRSARGAPPPASGPAAPSPSMHSGYTSTGIRGAAIETLRERIDNADLLLKNVSYSEIWPEIRAEREKLIKGAELISKPSSNPLASTAELGDSHRVVKNTSAEFGIGGAPRPVTTTLQTPTATAKAVAGVKSALSRGAALRLARPFGAAALGGYLVWDFLSGAARGQAKPTSFSSLGTNISGSNAAKKPIESSPGLDLTPVGEVIPDKPLDLTPVGEVVPDEPLTRRK